MPKRMMHLAKKGTPRWFLIIMALQIFPLGKAIFVLIFRILGSGGYQNQGKEIRGVTIDISHEALEIHLRNT